MSAVYTDRGSVVVRISLAGIGIHPSVTVLADLFMESNYLYFSPYEFLASAAAAL